MPIKARLVAATNRRSISLVEVSQVVPHTKHSDPNGTQASIFPRVQPWLPSELLTQQGIEYEKLPLHGLVPAELSVFTDESIGFHFKSRQRSGRQRGQEM